MNILSQNAKLKRTSKQLNTKVLNFGIPAYKAADGKLTCPMADKCIKFCYARKGFYTWKNVSPAFEKRYQLSLTDRFVDVICADITIKQPNYIRVHDSGDYYSRAYLHKWIEVAIRNPDVRFYSYTNMVTMFKNVKLPPNFDVIFSDSGKQVSYIDKKVDRHTKIFKTEAELHFDGYVNASQTDLLATKWFSDSNKIGLIMH